MSAWRWTVVAGTVAFLLPSCAPKPLEVLLDTNAVSSSELVRLVEDRAARIHSMTGKGTVSFDSPEIGGTAGFTLALKKPDSLLVKFEGPFGIDVGTLFLSRERYVIYNTMDNRVVTGVPAGGAMRSVIPFDLTHEQILNSFAGAFEVPGGGEPLSYRIDDERFLLSYSCDAGTCSYWVDPRSLLVTKYERRDAQQQLVMAVNASLLTEQNNITLPRRIVVKFPREGRQLSIYYSSVELNPSHPSFEYTIPDNAHTTVR